MSPLSPGEAAFREQRRVVLRQASDLWGIDYVEVDSARASFTLWRLEAGFVPRAPAGLSSDNLRIWGPDGALDSGLTVLSVEPAEGRPLAAVVEVRCDDAVRGERLSADPSEYELELVGLPTDRFFARAPFRFDGRCAGELAPAQLAARLPPPPEIDYLAKDFESFRRLMLDRISTELPDWGERSPADLGVTLVELLAYAADYLSFRQDAVATEAYLDTARRRVSVRRHARLLGYHLHEGSNARAWVQIQADPGGGPVELPAGTRLLTHAGQLPTVEAHGPAGRAVEVQGHYPTVIAYPSAEYDTAIEQGSLVFETLQDLRAHPDFNAMPLYAWGTERYVLEPGATSVALAGHPGATEDPVDEALLREGDVLILEQSRDPATGRQGGDPSRRHAVRLVGVPHRTQDPATGQRITEVRFHEADALPFPLTVSATVGDRSLADVSVALGNVALADHGETVLESLPTALPGEPYRPSLANPGLVWSTPYLGQDPAVSAAAAVKQQPEETLPAVRLLERFGSVGTSDEPWFPRRDLLESSAFAQEFVVETDAEGGATLRFGDGRFGRAPLPGTSFEAMYRIGGGPSGQVGADSIAHIVENLPDRSAKLELLYRKAREAGRALEEDLAELLASEPTADSHELEALWRRVLDHSADSGPLVAVGEAREALRHVPDLEERLAALASEAARLDLSLADDVATYIARHVKCDLEGPEPLLRRVDRWRGRRPREDPREVSMQHAAAALDQGLGVIAVRNPLPAQGGQLPETLERARLLAPRSFRRRSSAVTLEDWRTRAKEVPEVLDAVAAHRCTGGWPTVVLYVHRSGGRPVDEPFRRRLLEELTPALLADRDLEIRAPVARPLELHLVAEPAAGLVPETVRQRVLDRLAEVFHPDRFGFGQPVFLADVIDASMEVPGVELVRAELFRPLDDAGEPVRSRIEPGRFEIATLPVRGVPYGRGAVEIDMGGVA